jgi:hypothetical protein
MNPMPENTDPPPAPIESLTVHRKLFQAARKRQAVAMAWGALLTTLWGFAFGVYVMHVTSNRSSAWVGWAWLGVEALLLVGMVLTARSITRAENRSIAVFDSAVKFTQNPEVRR